jgi:hypothetical protein
MPRRLGRVITLDIVLPPMARSSRAMTKLICQATTKLICRAMTKLALRTTLEYAAQATTEATERVMT